MFLSSGDSLAAVKVDPLPLVDSVRQLMRLAETASAYQVSKVGARPIIRRAPAA
jgi:hypothetical protein